MDRFIAIYSFADIPAVLCLKSNMDRFIEEDSRRNRLQKCCLKSNMDRFIGVYYIKW